MSGNRPVSAGEGGIEPDEYAIPLAQEEDALPTAAEGGDQPPSKIIVGSNSSNNNINDQSQGHNDKQSQLQMEDPLESSEIFPIGNDNRTTISPLKFNSEKINNLSEKLSNNIEERDSDSVISNKGYVPPGRSPAIPIASINSEKQVESSRTNIESIQDAEGPSNSMKSRNGDVELPGYVFDDSNRDPQKMSSKKMSSLTIDPTASVIIPAELIAPKEKNQTTYVDEDEEDDDGADWGGMKSTKENKSFSISNGPISSSSSIKEKNVPILTKLETSMSMMGITGHDSEDLQEAVYSELQAVVMDSDMPMAMEGLVTDTDANTRHSDMLSELSRHSSQVLASQQSSIVLDRQVPSQSQSQYEEKRTISDIQSHNQSFQSLGGTHHDGQILVFIAHSPKKPVEDVINPPDHMVSIGFNDDDSLANNDRMNPLVDFDDAEDPTGGFVDDLGSLSVPMLENNSTVSSVEDSYYMGKNVADMDMPDFPSSIPDPNSRPATSSSSNKVNQQTVDKKLTQNMNHPLGRQEKSLSAKQLQGDMRSAATPADLYVNSMQSRLTKRISDLKSEPPKLDVAGNEGSFHVTNEVIPREEVMEDDVKVIENIRDQRDSSLLQDEQKAQTQQQTTSALANVKDAQSLKRQQQLQDNDSNTATLENSSNNSTKVVSDTNTPSTETPGKRERAVRFAMTENVTLIESVNEPSTAPWGPPPGGFPLDIEDDEPTQPIVAAVTMVSDVKKEVVKQQEELKKEEVKPNVEDSNKEDTKGKSEKEVQESDDIVAPLKMHPHLQCQRSNKTLHQSYVYQQDELKELTQKISMEDLLQKESSSTSMDGNSNNNASLSRGSSEVAATVAAAASGVTGKLAKQKLRGYVLGAKSIDFASSKDSTSADVEAKRLEAIAEAERLHRLREEHERKKIEAELARHAAIEAERARLEEEKRLEEERMNRYGKAKSLGFHSFKVGLSRHEYERMKENSIYIRPTSPLKPSSPPKMIDPAKGGLSSPSNNSATSATNQNLSKSPTAKQTPINSAIFSPSGSTTASGNNTGTGNKRRASRRISILKTVLKPLHLGAHSHDNEDASSPAGDISAGIEFSTASPQSKELLASSLGRASPSSSSSSSYPNNYLPVKAKSETDKMIDVIQADDLIDKRFGWQRSNANGGSQALTAAAAALIGANGGGGLHKSMSTSSQLLQQIHNEGVLSGQANSYSSTHNNEALPHHPKSFLAKSFRTMRSGSIAMLQQGNSSGRPGSASNGNGQDMHALRNARAKRANAADFIPAFDDEYHPHSIFEHYSGFVFHDPSQEFYQRPWDAELFPEKYGAAVPPFQQQQRVMSAGGTRSIMPVNTTGLHTTSMSAPASPSPFAVSIPNSANNTGQIFGDFNTSGNVHGMCGPNSKPGTSNTLMNGGTLSKPGTAATSGGKRYLKAGYMINCYRPWGSERPEDELEEFVKRSLHSASASVSTTEGGSYDDWDDASHSSQYSGSGIYSASYSAGTTSSSPMVASTRAANWPPHVFDATADNNSNKNASKSSSALDVHLEEQDMEERHHSRRQHLSSPTQHKKQQKQTRLKSKRHLQEENHDSHSCQAEENSPPRTQFPPIASPSSSIGREINNNNKPIFLLDDMGKKKHVKKKRPGHKTKASFSMKSDSRDIMEQKESEKHKKHHHKKHDEKSNQQNERKRLMINIIEALPGFVLPNSP